MNENATTNIQIDPTLAQAIPDVQYKQCIDCDAMLPLSHFGLTKRSHDGHAKSCKACRSEYNQMNWTRKYGRKYSYEQPDVIRSVNMQNRLIVDQALPLMNQSFTCIGFVPHSGKVYRIHLGHNRYDMPSIAIFNEDGSSYWSLAWSGVPNETVKGQILGTLKIAGIRLELSDVHMIASKNVIYSLYK